jgi:hypothetical protein
MMVPSKVSTRVEGSRGWPGRGGYHPGTKRLENIYVFVKIPP